MKTNFKNIVLGLAVFGMFAGGVSSAQAASATCTTLNFTGTVQTYGIPTTVQFEWGTNSNTVTNRGGSKTVSQTFTVDSPYSFTLSGLTPNTTYYALAVFSNANGTKVSPVRTFYTTCDTYVPPVYPPYYPPVYPPYNPPVYYTTVVTTGATNVTTSSATLTGTVSGNSSVNAGFEWGTSPTYLGTYVSQNSYSGYSNYNYTAYISGLNPNTVYYYRATAPGATPGQVMSFTTSPNYNYPQPVPCPYMVNGVCSNIPPAQVTNAPGVVTTVATQIMDSSAQLNAIVLSSNGASSNAWFEWGTSSALGYKTNTTNVGNTSSIRHLDTISGLTRGTTYYYRAVAENSYGRKEGTIMSFVAGYVAPTQTVIVDRTINTTQSTTTVTDRGVGTQSLITLTVSGGTDTISPSERRNYTVTWKNDSTQVLHNVALRVILPASLSFETADKGSFSQADNTLSYNVKDLTAGETGNLIFSATSSRALKNGELVVTVGDMVYTDAKNVQGDALAYATQTGVLGANDNGLGASVFGTGFFPSTLFGWILLIILILLLVLTGNHLYGRFSGAPKGPAAH